MYLNMKASHASSAGHRSVTRALAAIALTVVVTSGLFAATSAAAAVPRAALKGVNVIGWGFSFPRALATDGKHVWVANIGANSVIELNASTGRMVRVISGASYQFNQPFAIAADGTHVWVANVNGNSVTELDATTGALVRVISKASFGLSRPEEIASDGARVWVGHPGSNSLTELNASTGALVNVIAGSAAHLSLPQALTMGDGRVWVANAGNSVVELNAATGSFVKAFSGPGLPVRQPRVHRHRRRPPMGGELERQLGDGAQCLDRCPGASDRTLWVWVQRPAEHCHEWRRRVGGQLPGGNSITELSASTGRFVRVITHCWCHLTAPMSIATDGGRVWVADWDGSSVTELSASAGALVRIVSHSSYGFSNPGPIATEGKKVWVLNKNGAGSIGGLGNGARCHDGRADQDDFGTELQVQQPDGNCSGRETTLGRQLRPAGR